MTMTEGHDMPEPIPDEELQHMRNAIAEVMNSGDDYIDDAVKDVALLLAEVDRLRAELDDANRLADYYHEDRDATAGFWEDSQAEVNRLQDELKAAKSTRFENNCVGGVAAHIQAETINDLRLN
jgi:uncharacterized small protein (DUF1192 family)